MARLSNFVPQDDASKDAAHDSAPLSCRVVRREEVDQSLRLLLAGPGGLAGDEQILDFLSFTMHRGIDVNAIWVAVRAGQIEWSMLPVVSPGRTMLILSPGRLFRNCPAASVMALANAICEEYSARGVHLAQLLLDPDQHDVQDVYAGCGFKSLAELIYLHRPVRTAPPLQLPASFRLQQYAPDLDPLFMQAITQSYEGSLDCPGLNGVRDIHDVLAGHKAGCEFVPQLWHVLLENESPRAVLLLNRSSHSDAIELVYLGLIPEARGRGISDLMMQLAVTLTQRDGKTELTLAVDSRNGPAIKLYHRHGMQRMASRSAMIRDLRCLAGPVSAAVSL